MRDLMRAVPPIANVKLCRTALGLNFEEPHSAVLTKALDGKNGWREIPPCKLGLEYLASRLVKLSHIAQHTQFFTRTVLDRVVARGVAEREDLANASRENRQLFFDFDSRLSRAF